MSAKVKTQSVQNQGASAPDPQVPALATDGAQATAMDLGGQVAASVEHGGLAALDLNQEPSRPVKLDKSAQLRAGVLEELLRRSGQNLDVRTFKRSWAGQERAAPAWAIKVMAEIQEDLGIQEGDLRAERHLRQAVAVCAKEIWLHSDQRPEAVVRYLESPLKTEGERLEFYGAHESYRQLVEDVFDRSRSYTEEDALVEGHTLFLERVGKSLCASLYTGAGAVNPNILLDECEGMPEHSTSLGGYPLYYVTKDGGVLSPEAVTENLELTNDPDDPQWFVVGCDVNYEDGALFWDHTNKRIRSAYAEPEDVITETETNEAVPTPQSRPAEAVQDAKFLGSERACFTARPVPMKPEDSLYETDANDLLEAHGAITPEMRAAYVEGYNKAVAK